MTTQTKALTLALKALETAWYHVGTFCPTDEAIELYDEARAAIKEALAQPEQEPVALETVYETIIQWDEGGGKRSRRELARRIVSLYTTPPRRKPLTDEQTIILKNTTCPEIDWKARYFVEMNNGERNKWMLEWFIAFKVAIEEAHGIKE